MRATISLIAAVFASFFACVSVAQAQETHWTLIESAGSVFVAQPLAAPRLVSLQESLAPGSTLTTGGNGRAVVSRGAQHITIGPNSRIALPAATADGMTKIIQDFGAAMFKVDKRGVQHFEVDTPLIAAVVKGTTFTVSVGANSHSVHVVEGLVEVSAQSGTQAVPVPAGATALVSRENPTVIQLLDAASSSGDVQRGPDTDSGAFGTPERRAADAESTKLASLTIPHTIGGGPLDVERLSNGLIGSGKPAASQGTAGAGNGRDQIDERRGNGAADAAAESDGNGKGNAVMQTPSPRPGNENAVVHAGTNASGAGLSPGNGNSKPHGIAVPGGNGNGNPGGKAIAGPNNNGNPGGKAITGPNGNGNLGGSVIAAARSGNGTVKLK